MTYQSEVLADSPLAYWKLDSGFVVDSASLGGWEFGPGVTLGGSPLIPDGGRSVHGDGANPIATNSAVPASLSGSNVTLEAWVNVPAGNTQGCFVKVGSTSNGWGMGIGSSQWNNSGRTLILLSEAVAWHPTTYSFPAAGTYHVMAVRGAGGAVTAYVNGSAVWSGTLTSPITAAGQMGVGGYTETNGFKLAASVQVDDVSIYAAALSSARVTAHFNGGSGSAAAVSADSPVTWLKLDETTTVTPVQDASGNGRTISLVNSPALRQPSLLGDGSGTSVGFDGATQYATVASAAWMDVTSGVSVEARVRPNAGVLSAGGFIASRWNGNNAFNTWLFGVTSAGKLTASVLTAGSIKTVTGATTLTAGTAYTVAFRWTLNGTVDVFLNGVLDGSASAPGAINNGGAPTELARAALSSGSGLSWNGLIDEVSVMASALSDARLSSRHAAAIASGVTTITGVVAGTLPALSGSAAGTVTALTTGTVAGALPSLTGSVAGTPVTTGASNGTLPALTGSVNGAVAGITSGTVDGTLPALSGSVTGDITAPITGTVAGTLPALTGSATDSTVGTSISVGVTVQTGALTLLNLVALPGVEVHIGLGLTTGDSMPVVPLPGTSVEIGCSLIARPNTVRTVDARGQRPQWRYVITDLNNTPLGELVDLEHDPVEDGVGDPATMQFTVATGSADNALIKPVERQCQVWDGDDLRLRGPILPGRPSDDGTSITYTIHDPSWFWRDGRRVITRIPQKNLIKNGDFKAGLTYWTRGFDADSKPKAAPTVRIVDEDFVNDSDGLNPIKAAEIVGTESFTESELSSNAVFWPNLATFRPGGVASIEAVANAMPTTAGLPVTVVGHTANDGTGNGLRLSQRRAEAAAAIIKGKRPGAVITTKGVGYYDPKPGFPIDSQEQRRVVIAYAQTVTADAKQWLRYRVEVTQPKEARYPLELTGAAMLKVADDWSVKDANMVSLKMVAHRKDVAKGDPWDEQYGQGSTSISDTDPVDRWIPQQTSVTIPPDGRAYYVDLYLYAAAARTRYTAVGIFPDEMLYFWGDDQANIFAGIMRHIQDPAMGHGDLGVGVRAPLTGIKRDREFAFRDLTPADTALDGLTAISRGLEWDTITTPTETTATTFYPRQGKTVDYVLAQGGNVAAAVPANTRDIGSNVIAQAQDLGSYRAVAYARDSRAFGGTLLERVVTAEQDTPLNELSETAKAELRWAKSSTPAYWLDIDPEFIEEVMANLSKGDTGRLILDYPTPVDALARIVRRQIHPDSLRLMVALEEA